MEDRLRERHRVAEAKETELKARIENLEKELAAKAEVGFLVRCAPIRRKNCRCIPKESVFSFHFLIKIRLFSKEIPLSPFNVSLLSCKRSLKNEMN